MMKLRCFCDYAFGASGGGYAISLIRQYGNSFVSPVEEEEQ